MTERIAIIDLGSNSARLIVMHIYVNGAYNLVYHQKETVRLSEGMHGKGSLQEEAMLRAIETMKIFAQMCQLMQVDKILAVATAAVRNAKNGAELLEQIREQTGICVQVIGGKEEARLGYIGAVNTIDMNDAVLFDLGGGSTELTLITDRKLQRSVSLPFGAVNLTEIFATQDKIGDGKMAELRDFITQHLNKVPWLADLSLPIIGIGGTARNIAKMDQKRKNYPFNKVHNYRLGDISLTDLWRALAATDLKQRLKFPGLSSERADIVVAGVTIIKSLFDVTGAGRFIISGCGVREGLFFQHYFAHTGQNEIVDDPLLHSTQNMLRFYKGNVAHADTVAALADAMFDGWQELHGLEPRDKTLLRVASLLHDIGITINYYDHARHSAYLTENARLFGLTHREQMLAAVVTGWHHGPAAKYLRNRLYSEFLDETDWQKARKLALLLAMAESLDTTQMGFVKHITAGLAPAPYLKVTTNNGEGGIELQEVTRHCKWFKREFGAELTLEHQ
ncbi:MAG: exopolyphosphatase [Negativicutes bacterium]|nr:exopolyphosphatase [Negativicutes bacterium]